MLTVIYRWLKKKIYRRIFPKLHNKAKTHNIDMDAVSAGEYAYTKSDVQNSHFEPRARLAKLIRNAAIIQYRIGAKKR